MKINELSKELNVTNKEVIDFLKNKDFKVSSHMQNATDEMIELVRKYFSTREEETAEEIPEEIPVEKNSVINPTHTSIPIRPTKTFKPDEQIPCRSVTPWKLNALGTDKNTVYCWNNFGDVEYVAYKDLQAWRRKNIVIKPKIIIEDPDLCEQWKREIGDIYKPFIGVDYPEELFDLPDVEFEKLLKTSNDTVKEIIKVTAVNMIKNENFPTIPKIVLIDNILGTCIKEFL